MTRAASNGDTYDLKVGEGSASSFAINGGRIAVKNILGEYDERKEVILLFLVVLFERLLQHVCRQGVLLCRKAFAGGAPVW